MPDNANHRTGREDCFICSRGHPAILERHHIVPKRYGGSDTEPNLVDLCPSCHRAIEALYDDRFWTVVGVITEERQLELIVGDVVDRLDALAVALSGDLQTLQQELQADYSDVDIDVAKQNAIERYLDTVDVDLSATDRGAQSDMDRVAAFITDTSTESYAPTVDTVVEMFDEAGWSEDRVVHAIEKLRQVGRAYHPDGEEGIRVIDS